MTRYSILLTTGITGIIDTEQHLEEGMEVTISQYNENADLITETGIISEIFDEYFLG